MTRSSLLDHVARYGQFSDEAAEVALELLAAAGYGASVAANLSLPAAVAVRLHAAKVPAMVAKSLLSHPWDEDTADTLFRQETRKSVLAAAARVVPLAERTLDYLADSALSEGKLAEVVLECQPLDGPLRDRFGVRSTTSERIRATSHLATDAAGLDALRRLLRDEAKLFARRAAGVALQLGVAVEEHPQVLDLVDTLDGAASLGSRARVALASSLGLSDPDRQRRLGGVGGDTDRSAVDMLVVSYLAVHPYLDRDVAVALDAELDVRSAHPARVATVRDTLRRRLDRDLFADVSTPLRSCHKELFSFLVATAVNDVGRPRSRAVFCELAQHADVSINDARFLLSGLGRFDGAAVHAAQQQLHARFPALPKPAAPASAGCRAQRERLVRLEQRTDRLSHAQLVAGDIGRRRIDHLVYGAEYGAMALAASHRFAGSRSLWQTFISLLPDFDGTVSDLLDACEML